MSERCSAANLNLHVCLFTGEEDTVRCPPPRHATRAETAHALRGLAHAGNGRFLWTTDTGEERVLNDCLNVFQQYEFEKKMFKMDRPSFSFVVHLLRQFWGLKGCCLLYSECCAAFLSVICAAHGAWNTMGSLVLVCVCVVFVCVQWKIWASSSSFPSGIVESDDISALIGEMETAANYCQKVSSEQCVRDAFFRLTWTWPVSMMFK